MISLLELIKKFTSKDVNVGSGLSNYDDFHHFDEIPTREQYLDYKEEIDNYIEKYFQILQSKNATIFTSEDFDPEELRANLNMYTFLLMKLIGTDVMDRDFSSSVSEYYTRNKQALEIKALKLKTYTSFIDDMEREISLRLIALFELLKSERFAFLENNQQYFPSIIDEIKNLQGNLVLVKAQKRSANTEVNTCLNNMEGDLLLRINLNYKSKEDFKENTEYSNELLKKRLDELKNDAKILLPPDILEQLQSKETDEKSSIVLYEMFIEKYLFFHKEEVMSSKKSEIDKINRQITEMSAKRVEEYKNSDTLSPCHWTELDLIENLMFNYLSAILDFYNVIRKYVEIDDSLYDEIYRISFEIQTYDIPGQIFRYVANEAEEKMYKVILREKLNCLVRDENGALQQEFGDLLKKVINTLSKMVDNCLKKDIVNYPDQIPLKILLYASKGISIEKALQTPIKNYNTKSQIFDWSNEEEIYYKQLIPLELSLFIDSTDSLVPFLTDKEYSYLLKLYKLVQENNARKGIYKLPQGIKKIKMEPDNYKNISPQDYYAINGFVRYYAENKRVIMPTSLEWIEGNIFDSTKVEDIVLNDGLGTIGDHAFESLALKKISIPSSVDFISETAFYFKAVETLEFKNYNLSKYFKNSTFLSFLLMDIIRAKNPSLDEYSVGRVFGIDHFLRNIILLDDELDSPIVITGEELIDMLNKHSYSSHSIIWDMEKIAYQITLLAETKRETIINQSQKSHTIHPVLKSNSL